jgi:formylmethanofuran dehydrogenase subunit E
MSTPIARAWATYQAGTITIEDFRALQNALMPRCDLCGERAGHGVVDARPICEVCYAAMLGAPLPSAECHTVRSVR